MTTSLQPTFELPDQVTNIKPLPPLQRRSESKGTAHDFWKHYQERPLDAIFRPKSVAVIGASETDGSVGKKPKTNEKDKSALFYQLILIESLL